MRISDWSSDVCSSDLTKALWTSLDGLEEDEAIGPHAAAALVPDAEHFMGQWSRATEGMWRRTLPARPRAWWPIGAGIAAALALVVVLWPGLRPDVPIRSYAASDRIESVQLPDGSSVRLALETAHQVGRTWCWERGRPYG